MSNQISFVESTFKKLSKTNTNIDSESTFKKLSKTNNNIVDEDETCSKNISITSSDALTNQFPENDDGWNEKKDKEAREAYIMARDCGTYDYYKFTLDFSVEEDLIKCPTCEEMIYSDEQNGMCYTCFKNEQNLYPDDIPMELRYRN